MTHPIKVGTVQVVDVETGKVVETRKNAFTMLPVADGVCQECAVDHAWDQPHNPQSLTYQMRFHATHGRWPTWSDAMAHCTPDVQAVWREQLVVLMRKQGLDIPEDLMVQKPAGR